METKSGKDVLSNIINDNAPANTGEDMAQELQPSWMLNPTGTICAQCGAKKYHKPDGGTICANGHENPEDAKATDPFAGRAQPHTQFYVGHTPDYKSIIFDFRKPISWISMSVEEAETIAKGIHRHVKECKRAIGTKGHGARRPRRG